MAERSVVVRLKANISDFQSGMRQAGQSVTDFGRQVSGQGNASAQHMETVGRSALLMSGTMAVGFGLAAKAAIDWESAWAGVLKTVDGSESELAALESGLRRMATELPATHGEIAAVAEAAGQLGVQTSAIEGFTRTMIDLGETTNLTADQAATSLARLANIMQTPQSEFDRMGSTVVALGNSMATTEAEIVDMATRLASAGRQVGMTEADVLAFSAALSSVGIEAEAGGTAFSRVLIEMQNAVMDGSDELETFASTAGMTAEEFARAFRDDAAGAAVAFTTGLRRVADEGGNTNRVLSDLGLADVRVGNALRSAAGAGDLFAESLALGNQAWAQNTALTDEAEKRYETTAAQLGMLRNQVVDLAIDAGGQLLPALRGTVDVASNMATGFAQIPGPLQAAGMGLGGIVIAGTGLIGVVGTLMPKIHEAQKALNSMGTTGQFVSRNLRGMATGAAALGAAFAAWSMWQGMMENARRSAEEFGQTVRQDLAATNFEGLVAGVAAVEDGIASLSSTVAGSQAPWDADKRAELRAGIGELEALRDEYAEQIIAAGELARAHGITNDEALALIRSTADIGDEAGGTAVDLDAMAASMSTEETAALAEQLGVTEEQLAGVADGARATTAAVEDYTRTVRASMDPLFGAVDALNNLEDAQSGVFDAEIKVLSAMDAYETAVREHGRGSDEAAAASLDLLSAQEDLSRANLDVAASAMDVDAAMFELNRKIQAGEVSVDRAADTLNQWVAQGLLTEDQARAVAEQFGWVEIKANRIHGRTITMTVIADVAQAQRTLDAINAAIAGTGRSLGSLMHQGRASGGPTKAGEIYWVGERGPELLYMPRDGHVFDAHTSARMVSGPAQAVTAPVGGSTIIQQHFAISGLGDAQLAYLVRDAAAEGARAGLAR